MELKDGGVNNTHSSKSKAEDVADRVKASQADCMILACTRQDILPFFSNMTKMISEISSTRAATTFISSPQWMQLFPDFDTHTFFKELEGMRVSSTGGYINGIRI